MQQVCWLTDRFREQARSHRGSGGSEEVDVRKSLVGASLLANGGNPVFEGEADDAFASRLAPTWGAVFCQVKR